MKTYLFSLLATSLIIMLIGFLTPDGEKSGLSKHVGLLSSLCITCVLIAPLTTALTEIREALNGDFMFPWDNQEAPDNSEYRDQLQSALDGAGDAYFTEMLTQTLENQFAIPTGEIRCVAFWERENENPKLTKITVLLSGSAIWRDAGAIEAFVSNLLGCPCTTAVE